MHIDSLPVTTAAIPLPAPSAPNEGRRADTAEARHPRDTGFRQAPRRPARPIDPAASIGDPPPGLPRAPFLAQYIAQEIMPARIAPGAVAAYARRAERAEAERAAAFDAFAWPETRLRVEA